MSALLFAIIYSTSENTKPLRRRMKKKKNMLGHLFTGHISQSNWTLSHLEPFWMELMPIALKSLGYILVFSFIII